MRKICSAIAVMFLVASGGIAVADGSGDPTAVKQNETGEWLDKEGNPTYKVTDGSVDWYTYSGYRRYHSDCHVCHGPDGMGST